MARIETANMNQVLALLRGKLGMQVARSKVWRAVRDLARSGDIADIHKVHDEYSPEDVDKLEGELWRMSAGWYQKRNVHGDEWAWVKSPAYAGKRLLRVAYERHWDVRQKREVEGLPGRLACWEWPTGTWSGDLVRQEDEDGYPVYLWVAPEGHDRTQYRERLLVAGRDISVA